MRGREALMRQIVAFGDEIGNHSYHHPIDPGEGEPAATQAAIRARVPRRTRPGSIVLLRGGGRHPRTGTEIPSIYMEPPSQEERGRKFAELHAGPCFLIPNPWDGGTARVLEALGFEALATTSSGFAFALGRADGAVTLDEVTEHVKMLVEASDLPISVDLENGYGAAPEQAARAIEAVAAVGAVGGSIEDWDAAAGIYEIGHAVERIAAAAAAAREQPFPFMLTARAENHIRGNPDLDDTIARLRAYEAAGADVLYAPGLADLEQIRAVVAAVDRPVNVLARPTLSVAEIAAAGAGRISIGGSLAWATVEAMGAVAARMLADGDLSGLRGGKQVYEWLGAG